MSHHRKIPTKEQINGYLKDTNWGRWGTKSGAGAINLITAEKRIEASRLVQTGKTVSLSRPLPVEPNGENPRPAQHYMYKAERAPNGGAAMDFYGSFYHGTSTTHIDALCHVWNEDGMWEGKNPDDIIGFEGASFGTIDEWKDGILTKGILLDVPLHRGEPYVTMEKPVHGWELEDIVKTQNLNVQPGDAIFVYCGREKYAEEHGGTWMKTTGRPGLHASCLPFIKDNDVSVLGWDMMDSAPNEYDVPWSVHGAIFAYGVALIDNALLEPLSITCRQESRYEFMVTINPLYVKGGTGSPANPIAVF